MQKKFRIRKDILSTGKTMYTIEVNESYNKYFFFGPKIDKWVELKEYDAKYWRYSDECSQIVRFTNEAEALNYLENIKYHTEPSYIY